MRFGFGVVARPMRPIVPSGSPLPVSLVQVSPPSAERYRPLPGPPDSIVHGLRTACHIPAKRILGFDWSNWMSIAPVLSSTYRMRCQFLPPSRERNTPRVWFGPKGWPRAATYTVLASFGCTIMRPIEYVSRSPEYFHVFPASVDL